MEFEDISKIVFNNYPTPPMLYYEKRTLEGLQGINNQFQAGKVSRAQASQQKQKLKELFETCKNHYTLMKMAEIMVVDIEFDFEKTEEYVKYVMEEYQELFNKAKECELLCYQNIAVELFQYMERTWKK